VRTHTYQYGLPTPVPDSTPPEHRPNTDDGPFEPLGQCPDCAREPERGDVPF
jgi:hypothetical protein